MEGGVPIISCLNLLPELSVKADCFAPWHLQRDIAWRAWEGEPGSHSGHCWEDYLKLEVTGPLMVRAWWPPLSSWPPGVCSPWLQSLRWHLGCPARPISPKTLVPALPSFGVGLTLVLSYNRLHNKWHIKQSMFISQHQNTISQYFNVSPWGNCGHAPAMTSTVKPYCRIYTLTNKSACKLILLPDRYIRYRWKKMCF